MITLEDRRQALSYLQSLFPSHFLLVIIGENTLIEHEGEMVEGVVSVTLTNMAHAEGALTLLESAVLGLQSNPIEFNSNEAREKMN